MFGEVIRLYACELLKNVEEQIEQEELTEEEKREEEGKSREFCEKMLKLAKEKYESLK